MNVSILEKIARQVLKGENTTEVSNSMLSGGVITPAEHRSLKSLSSQIAANIQATTGMGGQVFAFTGPSPRPDSMWG